MGDKASPFAICYIHLLLTGFQSLTYSNYIFTDFDKCRITTTGKLSVAGTPSNLGLILEHITNLAEVRNSQCICLFYAKLRPQHVDVRAILFSMMAKICILI
jgi:hypothetical protein